MNKGMLNGTCNLSRCITGKPATYYNHGSLSHYCEDCAKMLSEDPVNKQDAMIRFGHDLCTLVDQTELNDVFEQGNNTYLKFENPYKDLDLPSLYVFLNRDLCDRNYRFLVLMVFRNHLLVNLMLLVVILEDKRYVLKR